MTSITKHYRSIKPGDVTTEDQPSAQTEEAMALDIADSIAGAIRGTYEVVGVSVDLEILIRLVRRPKPEHPKSQAESEAT
jgi:hypothetical protein